MLDASPVLNDFIKDKSTELNLYFDAYSKRYSEVGLENYKKATKDADVKYRFIFISTFMIYNNGHFIEI